MKNTSKIGLTTFILVAFSIVIGIFTFKILYSLNSGLTESYIFISVITGIAAFIILPIASNLIAFLITYFCDQKDMNKKQDEAFAIIKEIKPHIKKESIILVSEDRKSLSRKGFFDDIYNNAKDIRISGIKLTPLIDYICENKKSSENWVKKLRSREDVTVRILMSSPKSKIIPTLEEQERLDPNTILDKIEGSLKKLSDFSNKNKNKLASGSSISIRTTDAIQYFNITYAGNEARQPTDKLLLGFLFNRDNGPLYEILPTNVNTYGECLELFNNLFAEGTPIFRWDEYGIEYTEI